MSASSTRQNTTPSYRTLAVLMAFCVGLAAGILLTVCALQNPTKGIAVDEKGRYVVHASSCGLYSGINQRRDASSPIRYRVQLSRIVDGDTIRVVWHDENVAVRLLEIDAPERRQPGSMESAECLRELVAGADTVDLEFQEDTPHRDSLGRLLADVWRGDVHLNLELVKRGHAGLYKGGWKDKYGDALREAARSRLERVR